MILKRRRLMIYAALLPLGEAPLLASVRIGKWKPKCKSFSGYLEMGPTFKIIENSTRSHHYI